MLFWCSNTLGWPLSVADYIFPFHSFLTHSFIYPFSRAALLSSFLPLRNAIGAGFAYFSLFVLVYQCQCQCILSIPFHPIPFSAHRNGTSLPDLPAAGDKKSQFTRNPTRNVPATTVPTAADEKSESNANEAGMEQRVRE